MIYIAEAHALDGDRPPRAGSGPLVEEPLTLIERIGVAQTCSADLDLSDFTILVDDIDDSTNKAYHAHPDRLYLIGKGGLTAFAGAPGPRGFNPDDLEEAVVAELDKYREKKEVR